ncbi:MAG: PEP-CTERM sorting domain-containing protein [Acidobacteria bacterium]|nr:PEP-CTERM sorting domain-containing protein [Acidobacteriota bacterium]
MKIFVIAAVVAFGTTVAFGNAITLTQVDGNLYQQTVQSPCIFSNPSCTAPPAGWSDTALPTGGALTGYDSLSPIYTGAQIFALIGAGNPLRIGLDINQASGQPAQTLTLFQMIKNGSVVDTFTGSTGNVPAGNNGNGYADFLLGNFSSFASGDTIQFHFVFNDANDGTENLFVIGQAGTTGVPEPSTWLLISGSLIGMGLVRRKRS